MVLASGVTQMSWRLNLLFRVLSVSTGNPRLVS
jgi:hypothetical protein